MFVSYISAKTDKKIAFGNKREDYYNIDYLAGGEQPILPNKKANILSSLNSFSKDSSDRNIQFLLDTASSLQYGVKPNSEFAQHLGVRNVSKLENIDWYKALDKAVSRAIKSSESPDKDDFEMQYLDVFGNVEPLSEQEKEILEYRENILSSDEMANAISSPDKLSYSADIIKYLDYFTASSEISKTQKHHCLKQMAYFLSPEYQIHPQLQDKKLQALSEILADIVVKTPDNPILSIKGVNQRETGMCAAISICRKAMAYEDKSLYIDLILAELNSSKQMEVFDVTKIGTNAKVAVNKADIDYEDALDRGYRILDAAAHNWMHLAQIPGNGKIESAHYVPFDRENDEIFQDSIFYKDLSGNSAMLQDHLRFIIKEREVISRIEKINAAEEKIAIEFPATKKIAESTMASARSGLIKVVRALYPDVDDKYAIKIVTSLLNSSKTRTVSGVKAAPEINIKEPAALIKNKIKSHLIDNTKGMESAHPIDEELNKLYSFYIEYKTAEESVSKSATKSTLEAGFKKAKSFYELGLIHRNSFFSGLNVEGRLLDYERMLKIPTLETRFNRHMDNLNESLSDPQKVIYWAKKLGVPANRADVESKFAELQTIMGLEIPHEVDRTLAGLGMGGRVIFLQESLKNLRKDIESDDAEMINNFAAIYACNPTKQELLPKIDADLKSLEDPDNEKIMLIARNFGFALESDFAYETYKSLQDRLESGDSKLIASMLKTYKTKSRVNAVFQKFAGDINRIIGQESSIMDLVELTDRYQKIAGMYEKDGILMRENELDVLRRKFESVRKEKLNRERTKARGEIEDKSKDIYLFSVQEKTILEKIEKNFSKYRKYANYQYRLTNRVLAPQLEELYASHGRQMGHFWVHEEGYSGLFTNQEIKIFEQMTGKAYYGEPDIDVAVGIMKKGNGNGIASTSVLDDEFALHAQYSPGVSSVAIFDPVSKKKEHKEVLWQDNSWGNSEAEELWFDTIGNQYTSYDKGYGGQGGYILSPEHKIGKTVDFFRSHYGEEKKDGGKVSQFFDMVVPGFPKNTYVRLNELYAALFDQNTAGKDLDELEKSISEGVKINIEKYELLQAQASQRTDEFMQKIDGKVYTKEEFEALPPDNLIRFFVEKQALIESLEENNMVLGLKVATSIAGLKKYKDDIIEQQRATFSNLMNKIGMSTFSVLNDETEEALTILFQEFEKNYGINLGDESEIESLFNVDENEFDGSYGSIKDHLILNAHAYVTSRVQDPKLADKFIKDIVAVVTTKLDETFRFDSIEQFVEGYGREGQQLIKIIDAVYEPKDNDELLGYIKKLQDMTKVEFDSFLDKAPKIWVLISKTLIGLFKSCKPVIFTIWKISEIRFIELIGIWVKKVAV